jgi:hypothetical protein
MLQICVHDQKVQVKTKCYVLKLFFLIAMIKNIKIHNILYIIEISKSMEPHKCIQIFHMKMFI